MSSNHRHNKSQRRKSRFFLLLSSLIALAGFSFSIFIFFSHWFRFCFSGKPSFLAFNKWRQQPHIATKLKWTQFSTRLLIIQRCGSHRNECKRWFFSSSLQTSFKNIQIQQQRHGKKTHMQKQPTQTQSEWKI